MAELAIDPTLQDYDGQRMATLANAVYLRLMTPLGSYWGDPALGSKLHLLAREKDVARVAVLAKQYSADALQPLIDDGRARSVVVETFRAHDGRLQLRVVVEDAGGHHQVFNHFVEVA